MCCDKFVKKYFSHTKKKKPHKKRFPTTVTLSLNSCLRLAVLDFPPDSVFVTRTDLLMLA